MGLYFFDTTDGETFIKDRDGVELPDFEAVKRQASLSLAELARDVIPDSMRRELLVEVSHENKPVLQARLHFEAMVLGSPQ